MWLGWSVRWVIILLSLVMAGIGHVRAHVILLLASGPGAALPFSTGACYERFTPA